MQSVAALLTCHNRRDKTISCLRALDEACSRTVDISYGVFLTDDGSTDGTGDAIRKLEFPVAILQGPGDLYWNRGMVNSWKAAIDDGRSFDGFLLLNDDTLLDPGGISTMLSTSAEARDRAIIVGAVRDPDSGEVTYGGVARTDARHPGKMRLLVGSDDSQEADTFNANCVFIPSAIYQKIGTLDPVFTHWMGDYDYGLRAKDAGFRVLVAPGTVGTCSRNSIAGTWNDPRIPIRKRLRLLDSPKGLPRSEWAQYLRRHGAVLPALVSWFPRLRVLASAFEIRVRRGPLQ